MLRAQQQPKERTRRQNGKLRFFLSEILQGIQRLRTLLNLIENDERFRINGNASRKHEVFNESIDIFVAFEKTGKDGKRYALRGMNTVVQLTEAELKSSVFPEGYKFPF